MDRHFIFPPGSSHHGEEATMTGGSAPKGATHVTATPIQGASTSGPFYKVKGGNADQDREVRRQLGDRR